MGVEHDDEMLFHYDVMRHLMEKIHENMHFFMLSCKIMHVFMYFVPT